MSSIAACVCVCFFFSFDTSNSEKGGFEYRISGVSAVGVGECGEVDVVVGWVLKRE